jgi:hypothetical protein
MCAPKNVAVSFTDLSGVRSPAAVLLQCHNVISTSRASGTAGQSFVSSLFWLQRPVKKSADQGSMFYCGEYMENFNIRKFKLFRLYIFVGYAFKQ